MSFVLMGVGVAKAKEELQEAAEQLDGVKDKLDGEMANAASMKQQLGGVVQGATHLKDHLNNVLSNAGNIMGGLGSMGSMLRSYEPGRRGSPPVLELFQASFPSISILQRLP